MSWTPATIIIFGVELARDRFDEAWTKIEDCEDDSLNKYEDFLFNSDPITGDGKTFLGKIIHNQTEDSKPVRLNTIIIKDEDVAEIKEAYHALIDPAADNIPIDTYLLTYWT